MLEEAALVTALLGAIIAAQLVVSKSFYLFTRNFWLDEIITNILVSDRDVRHSLRAIAGGLDTNPPGYHLLLRAFRMLVGRRGEATLRSFSLLSALAALVGLYLNLRQVYLPLTALAAVLAVWSHPLVLSCAFEARMYAPWLAAVVWFSYALARSWNASTDVWLHVLLACTGILICALHTLGPLTVALVVAAHLLFHYSEPWNWDTLMWASLGLIIFLGWIPFLWKQNFANPVTWVSPPTKHTVAKFGRSLLIPEHLATALVLAGGLSAFLQVPWSPSMQGNGLPDAAVLAGVAGLVLMPVSLVILSYIVQPLLVDRYATPTVAAFAPAIASVISPLPPFWMAVLCGALFVIGVLHLQSLRATYWTQDQETAELIDAIHRHAGEEPVFFETLHELSVVSHYAGVLSKRCSALDFDEDALDSADGLGVALRNHARILSKFYALLTLTSWNAVRTLPQLYLVPSALTALKQGRLDFDRRYASFTAAPLAAGLYHFVARGGAITPNRESRSADMQS